MTVSRLIPLPYHAVLEMVIGLALMAAPFALGFGAAGAIVAIVAGAMLVGLALAASATEPGRGTIHVGAHYALDRGLVVGLVGAAAVIGTAGDPLAGVVIVAFALALLALSLTTKYSLRG